MGTYFCFNKKMSLCVTTFVHFLLLCYVLHVPFTLLSSNVII